MAGSWIMIDEFVCQFLSSWHYEESSLHLKGGDLLARHFVNFPAQALLAEPTEMSFSLSATEGYRKRDRATNTSTQAKGQTNGGPAWIRAEPAAAMSTNINRNLIGKPQRCAGAIKDSSQRQVAFLRSVHDGS